MPARPEGRKSSLGFEFVDADVERGTIEVAFNELRQFRIAP